MRLILFPKHARVRCAQRGIDESLIFMVLAYGRAEYDRQGQGLCPGGQPGQGVQVVVAAPKKKMPFRSLRMKNICRPELWLVVLQVFQFVDYDRNQLRDMKKNSEFI